MTPYKLCRLYEIHKEYIGGGAAPEKSSSQIDPIDAALGGL